MNKPDLPRLFFACCMIVFAAAIIVQIVRRECLCGELVYYLDAKPSPLSCAHHWDPKICVDAEAALHNGMESAYKYHGYLVIDSGDSGDPVATAMDHLCRWLHRKDPK